MLSGGGSFAGSVDGRELRCRALVALWSGATGGVRLQSLGEGFRKRLGLALVLVAMGGAVVELAALPVTVPGGRGGSVGACVRWLGAPDSSDGPNIRPLALVALMALPAGVMGARFALVWAGGGGLRNLEEAVRAGFGLVWAFAPGSGDGREGLPC
jgi:hypothetical protein